MTKRVINRPMTARPALAAGGRRSIMNDERTGMGAWINARPGSLWNDSTDSLFFEGKLGRNDNPFSGQNGRSDRPPLRGRAEELVSLI
jgi:hypothetical protein